MDKWIRACSTAPEAARVIQELPATFQVVYTYGVWDLLHPGHIKLLTRARELGDFLVVGVVADEPVRELKGPGRPTQHLKERLEIVGSLRFVDIAIPQKLYDPSLEMLELGRLNILTKGDDWEKIPGTETINKMGGRLVKLSYSPEHSSSSLIAKISGQQVKPAREPKC
jgi:rfaE bifunctional protein nucleotidyltransferase chain/domain